MTPTNRDEDPTVAVVGAAGFVGRELLRQLEAHGIRAMAIVRGAPELSVDGDFHVACSASEAPRRGFDVVVNLAYPTSGPPAEHPAQNAALVRTVDGLVKDGGHLIQVSTLAVFGLTLDRPVTVGPVTATRDNPYVESKIDAEISLSKRQSERRLALDIVRLGNVWGYASGAWALPVVHRLLTGRPLGVIGAPGHSNTTDVTNVADYLAFLVQQGAQDPGVRYHHLAEFSSVRWEEWITPIAAVMGVEPVYANPTALDAPSSGLEELAEVLAPMLPRSIHRRLAMTRIGGSWTRTIKRRLPMLEPLRSEIGDLVFAADPQLDYQEQTFLAIMAGKQEFRSVVRHDWHPPVSQDQSLERVLGWLKEG